MLVLFDQGTPEPLRNFLAGHDVHTARQHGWSELVNGELLRAAEESGFDVFVTPDKNLRYQQNLARVRLAIVVLPTNIWPLLKEITADVAAAVDSSHPGSYVEVPFR